MLSHMYKTLKSLPRNPKSMIKISHFHTRKKTLISNPAIDFILDEFVDHQPSNPVKIPTQDAPKTVESVDAGSSSIKISHQWPEWIWLMQKLIKIGYFDVVGNPFQNGGLIDGKGFNQIRTACLNFARDRPDLVRKFTSGYIQTVAGSGCPSIDRKVVNSGKRLRAHMGIDEGNICSTCILRGNCERAYMKAHKDEGAQTVDVMRFILTYGLHHLAGEPDNELSMNKKFEEAIRSLIREMVEFSKEELDLDPSKHEKIPKNGFILHERVERSGNNGDQVQLKRGDWVCKRCNILNFAKNTRCFMCNTNPPKRQLNPGEWECDSCNYINFRRNMSCLKCDHNRPKSFK